ncbi:transcription initiation protein [Flavobacterium sp. MAH-1]|uniref:Transcription initiation protein n=1 Tax=Flavobacterium agri TaxID=2743471 RepID=A0A7Y8Y340_9FLAO|nr:YciI family protein [Flavobacterium agri]NUY80360.1 transcription initiation protein [Flavobacterium agri]NYA70385.1 transcription initiation protein [Flavobacterium agri]
MQEFLVVIHRDFTSANPTPTPEQMKNAMQPYQQWIGSLASQDKLVAPPKRWDADGRVITKNGLSSGPYAEVKESIGGLFLVKANDYDEAVELAKGCPIIEYGATVEVRQAVPVA